MGWIYTVKGSEINDERNQEEEEKHLDQNSKKGVRKVGVRKQKSENQNRE